MNSIKRRLLPFTLTFVIIFLDQITKFIIESTLKINEVGLQLLWGFIRILHDKNLGVALGIGRNLPYIIRLLFFSLFPLTILGFAAYYVFNSEKVTNLQRWAIAGAIGGGIGNIIDRIFRPEGVVDFISIKLYNLFGLSHFPTFNIADSSLTICASLFFISFIINEKMKQKKSSRIAENEIDN